MDYKSELRGLLAEIMSEQKDKTKEIAEVKDEAITKILESNAELKARIAALEAQPAYKVALPVPGENKTVNAMYKGYDLRKQGAMLSLPEDRKEHVAKFLIDAITGKAAMAEGSGSTGGYAVPEEFASEILGFSRLSSTMLRDCRVVDMKSDVWRVPAELTNVAVSWKAEAVAHAASDPTLAEIVLTADRLGAYSTASQEFLADTQLDVVSWLTGQFAEAIGQEIDDSVLYAGRGAGLSSTWSGICSAGSTATVTCAATGTSPSRHVQLTHSEISQAIASMSTNKTVGAKFYFARASMHAIRTMVDGASHLIWTPPFASTPAAVYDYPYEVVEKLAAAPGAATTFALFSNLKRCYIIGRRSANVNLFVDPYTKSAEGQVRFILATRWAGAVALPGGICQIKTHA